jgi:hypothetical protein
MHHVHVPVFAACIFFGDVYCIQRLENMHSFFPVMMGAGVDRSAIMLL